VQQHSSGLNKHKKRQDNSTESSNEELYGKLKMLLGNGTAAGAAGAPCGGKTNGGSGIEKNCCCAGGSRSGAGAAGGSRPGGHDGCATAGCASPCGNKVGTSCSG